VGAEVRALISIHSFTPVFHGVDRHVDVGLVWPGGSQFGALVSEVMHRVGSAHGIVTADNIPYAWTDTGARTLNVHGTAQGRRAVCIEVRNCLLLDAEARSRQLAFLTDAFQEVAEALHAAA
jgi:predicted N-formylglutamate amidohydrolase